MITRSSATRYPLPATRRLPATPHPPPATRSGFTLAEVLIALALLGLGALAVVAASAGAVRTVASAEAQRFAVAVAQARVEELAARHCSTLRDGDARDSSRRMRERWTVTRYGNAVHLLTDSVEYLDRAAPRWAVARRLMVC